MKTEKFTNEHGEEFLLIKVAGGYYLFGSETDYRAIPMFEQFELSDSEMQVLRIAMKTLEKS